MPEKKNLIGYIAAAVLGLVAVVAVVFRFSRSLPKIMSGQEKEGKGAECCKGSKKKCCKEEAK
jgi:hypothetical protein